MLQNVYTSKGLSFSSIENVSRLVRVIRLSQNLLLSFETKHRAAILLRGKSRKLLFAYLVINCFEPYPMWLDRLICHRADRSSSVLL